MRFIGDYVTRLRDANHDDNYCFLEFCRETAAGP